MKQSEIQRNLDELIRLREYCNEEKIGNFSLNRILRNNIKIFSEAVDEFSKCVPNEIKDKEEKIIKVGREYFEALTEEEKEVINQCPNKDKSMIALGLIFVPESQAKEYQQEAQRLLEEDCEISPYILKDESKVNEVCLPPYMCDILIKYIEDN